MQSSLLVSRLFGARCRLDNSMQCSNWSRATMRWLGLRCNAHVAAHVADQLIAQEDECPAAHRLAAALSELQRRSSLDNSSLPTMLVGVAITHSQPSVRVCVHACMHAHVQAGAHARMRVSTLWVSGYVSDLGFCVRSAVESSRPCTVTSTTSLRRTYLAFASYTFMPFLCACR